MQTTVCTALQTGYRIEKLYLIFTLLLISARQGGPVHSAVLQGPGPADIGRYARCRPEPCVLDQLQRLDRRIDGRTAPVPWHVHGGLRQAQHPAAQRHDQRTAAPDQEIERSVPVG